MNTDPASWLRGTGPRAADVGIALLVQGAMSMPWVLPRDPGLPAASPAAYLLMTLTVLPLVWRRRAPAGVLLAVLVAQCLYGLAVDGPGQTLPYNGLLALYTVAALSPSPRRQLAGVLVTAVIFPSVALNTGEARELMFSLTVFAASYAMGRLTHTRQAYTAAVEDRARQLERANRIEAEQAGARERARIAREMHDILSHAVSIMIVQAEAGPIAVRSAPERAEAAFDSISETGRDAMVQLRRMLGLLRDGAGGEGTTEDGTTAAPGAPGAPGAPREPQPDLGALPTLVHRVSLSGPKVLYETSGRPRPLPLDTETTVYRVVQEALTNVVRHADARTATVLLAYGEEQLTVMVTDDGRGPAGGPPAGASHGLTGVQERASAHGGTARSGPGPGGRGFEVRLTLPLVTSVQGVRS
ncbi:sensor histidine kinase [Streptomyces sp. NPDC055287]